MNTSFDNGVQVVWDNTSLELVMECPRKYYWRMIANIVPTSTSVHLLFGGLYASALEHYHKHRAKGKTHDEALHLVVRETLLASWDDDAGQAYDFNHAAKTRPNLIRTIVWYLEDQNEDETLKTFHLQDGTPAVELTFKLEFTDDITLSGHLDRVVEWSGDLYWTDNKTTKSALGSYYFDQYTPGNQPSQYTWAGQAIFKSPIAGGIIDAAQIAVGFSRFSRGFIHRTNGQLEEWAESTLYTIREAQAYTERNQFPMRTTSCNHYTDAEGMGGCPYKLLCSKDRSIRDKFIDGHYKRGTPWDPNKER